ncbi:helix-turn-helix domain-containing protein [Tenacibaculum ovolyticum]|uniref:helix-turn-helix domain-containing protein n=1 Tax=Tenacibaculum ovolyticum TaxID=104270 RepID=UPI003A5C3561
MADSLKTNTTYISFVFNKHNEESFSQYYTKRKIEYIIDQLKTNATYRKYSIQALAEEIGYTNASAFTRAFKKQIGVTPSAFLKSLNN